MYLRRIFCIKSQGACQEMMYRTSLPAIHQLITRMDGILDLLEDAVQTVSMYDVKAASTEAKRIAGHCR
ncbi:hypothetical protein RCH09_002827 [Actimicrobium sp. GrIS 1.19]|nr:hypothetical protein [Actimicrobium sp. GrIS 1.19]